MMTLKENLFLTAFLLLCTLNGISQAPNAISYQAVARDTNGLPLKNQLIGVRISIERGAPGGTVVYQETHQPTTNEFGLFNLPIGQGSPITGAFKDINWRNGPFFHKVEIDPTGGASYLTLGTTQLLSVPYAQHSRTSASDSYFTTLPADCQCVSSIPTTYTKVGDIGTFNKANDTSMIELTFSGLVKADTSDGTGIRFELRIDDLPTSMGRARAVITTSEMVGSNKHEDISINGLFPDLAAGSHTVSLYAVTVNGTSSTSVCYDPGCWNTSQVIVEEMITQ